MSLKRVDSFLHEGGARSAVVYRDGRYGGYLVQFYRDGAHQKQADSRPDEEEDALETARFFVWPTEIARETA
jgi:hypothetical protein